MAKISLGQEANKCPLKLQAVGWVSLAGWHLSQAWHHCVTSEGVASGVLSPYLDGHAPGEPDSTPAPLG